MVRKTSLQLEAALRGVNCFRKAAGNQCLPLLLKFLKFKNGPSRSSTESALLLL